MKQLGPYKVGDVIRPADGSNYRGEIVYISKEEDVVRHRCLITGTIYTKSYFGFFCRYCTLDEYEDGEDFSDLGGAKFDSEVVG
jgi:hypothetical protein